MDFNQGEIFILKIPSQNGHEQEGLRPGIIISNTTNLVHIVPLTSNLNATKFEYSLRILKNKNNNLEKDSIALIFQLKTLDKRRLIKKIGNIDNSTLNKVKEILSNLLKINIITQEKIEKYFKLTETALKEVKKNIIRGKEKQAKEIIEMVTNYISDAKYFYKKEDLVNAFAALNYAHGWIDSGVRLEIFDVNDNKLFTVK